MKDATYQVLEPLLGVLRGYSTLDEVRVAEFHLKGRDFIHFHETPHGVFADVLLSRGRVHMPASTEMEQAELLERVERQLSSLERHEAGKQQRKARRRT